MKISKKYKINTEEIKEIYVSDLKVGHVIINHKGKQRLVTEVRMNISSRGEWSISMYKPKGGKDHLCALPSEKVCVTSAKFKWTFTRGSRLRVNTTF
jgi:hypothetical protein